MRVYVANLPLRTGSQSVLLRILSETKHYLTIKVSRMPGGPAIRTRTWTVAREDLDVMVSTRLARRITTLKCVSCSSSMAIYEGQKGTRKRPGVFFACSGCEACCEI